MSKLSLHQFAKNAKDAYVETSGDTDVVTYGNFPDKIRSMGGGVSPEDVLNIVKPYLNREIIWDKDVLGNAVLFEWLQVQTTTGVMFQLQLNKIDVDDVDTVNIEWLNATFRAGADEVTYSISEMEGLLTQLGATSTKVEKEWYAEQRVLQFTLAGIFSSESAAQSAYQYLSNATVPIKINTYEARGFEETVQPVTEES